MDDQIICPNCRKPIPLTQALSHQLQEKYKKIIQEDRQRQSALFEKKLAEEKLQFERTYRTQVAEKVKKEMELQFADKKNENEELKKQNINLQEQFLQLNKLIRQLRTDLSQKNIEMQKRLSQEQEKIREEEKRLASEQNRLKILEYEKKLQDVLKVNEEQKRINEELKRKAEQGSQQTQGEVLELALENMLRQNFPYDEIKPVPKGVTGADIIQIVRNNAGRECGTIIWESKRTKVWSDGWVAKLKEDKRQVKADMAAIITQVLPDKIKIFGSFNDVWVGSFDSVTGLAVLLRHALLNVATVKLSMVGKQEKKEILWNYLTGIEFKQRIEAIYDAYNQLQADLEIEKRWFTKKWAKQEKNIRMVLDNILGMHGDMQSIVGKALSELKDLEVLPEKTNEPLFSR